MTILSSRCKRIDMTFLQNVHTSDFLVRLDVRHGWTNGGKGLQIPIGKTRGKTIVFMDYGSIQFKFSQNVEEH